jgi:tripartite ATP-independent transporter DctM subunit
MEIWAVVMFALLIGALMAGYPVAFTLGAVALLFGGIFLLPGDSLFFGMLPMRIWGIMTNFNLLAVPLFVFMGLLLEKSGLAENLLETMGLLFGRLRGGLAVAIVLVGMLLAATTGVAGATVVTMGIIALPTLLKHGYSPALATGTIAASGTLGQIIPPSVILILLGDIAGVPVGSLFIAAIVPGLLIVLSMLLYVAFKAWREPASAPVLAGAEQPWNRLFWWRVIASLLPPLLLIVAVLGSIFAGLASPTESAAIGAIGAALLAAAHRRLSLENFIAAMRQTLRLTSMVFFILIGATAFGLVFRGMGGDHLVHGWFTALPGGVWGFLLVSMLLVFVLGFFLDFLEICFIVVPILVPIALHLQIDPLWFAVLLAVNLQTSFLTPPFGFSLFYLKAVAPPGLPIQVIYRGIVPYVALQMTVLGLILLFPKIALWLPAFMDSLRGY